MGRASNVRANTKAKTDAAKANNYSSFVKRIITAVKSGGGDPVANRLLAALIADAKDANVPIDVIKRNIEKANNPSTATDDYKELLYEFTGPDGSFILVNVLTDNVNR